METKTLARGSNLFQVEFSRNLGCFFRVPPQKGDPQRGHPLHYNLGDPPPANKNNNVFPGFGPGKKTWKRPCKLPRCVFFSHFFRVTPGPNAGNSTLSLLEGQKKNTICATLCGLRISLRRNTDLDKNRVWKWSVAAWFCEFVEAKP